MRHLQELSEGRTFLIQDNLYVTTCLDKDPEFSIDAEFCLVTAFMLSPSNEAEISVDWISQQVKEYKHTDDVFHEAFLANVVFVDVNEPQGKKLSDEAWAYLSKCGCQWVEYTSSIDGIQGILPGPYAILGGHLSNVWKLVDDTNRTLMCALRPQQVSAFYSSGNKFIKHRPFSHFQRSSIDCQSLSVALPSRIGMRAKFNSPIAGYRVLVKDNIHLQGIKTSLGNRAFYDTYPAQPETARCITRLIDCGVTVLGKGKMSSFGNWEEPTDYTDYQAPWNPRGDRYQSPGASSSGCAAAIASYDWLDIAIGTDTWGSVTRPSLWCGCFGLRPSIGAVSLEGVEPYVSVWDIPGILGRDLEKCRKFASVWLERNSLAKDIKPFSSIIWPTDFWKIIESEQCKIAQRFVQDMESHLNLKHAEISFEDVWLSRPPPEVANLSLPDYIVPATSALAYDAYHNSEDFRQKHLDIFQCQPYTTHANEKVWTMGKKISQEERDEGFRRLETYARWFKDIILTGDHSNALIVLPLESIEPRYRDEPPLFKRPPQDGINALALGPVMKSPVLAVPIGEVMYESKVTKRAEKLPFVVAVMAAPGMDMALMDSIISILRSADRPTSVKAGATIF